MGDLLIPMTENHVLKTLAARYPGKGLFIPHCKTGPSYGDGQLILDAWYMPYSWTKPIIGYEVKVSRSDFLRDRKWINYLPFCNLFYFVTPYELIRPDEIPDPAGLIWLTKNGERLRYAKRAASRWYQQIPASVFMYVLMWRGDKQS